MAARENGKRKTRHQVINYKINYAIRPSAWGGEGDADPKKRATALQRALDFPPIEGKSVGKGAKTYHQNARACGMVNSIPAEDKKVSSADIFFIKTY